ncbi:hypothetical protein MTO96_028898 [Rhipicephalus appendiculatus]
MKQSRQVMAADHRFLPCHQLPSRPRLQLYFVLEPLGEGVVSVAYAFMTRKNQEAYEDLLKSLRDQCELLGLTLYPDIIVCDFEKVALNAVKAVFGEDVERLLGHS